MADDALQLLYGLFPFGEKIDRGCFRAVKVGEHLIPVPFWDPAAEIFRREIEARYVRQMPTDPLFLIDFVRVLPLKLEVEPEPMPILPLDHTIDIILHRHRKEPCSE